MNPTLLIGDCRPLLKTLPEKHFHTCVTSPPYWGLRRYLAPDHPMAKFEIGQEPTIQGYVDTMLTVAEGIWHTLRDDGTFWLNLGDSYATHSSGAGHGGLKALSDRCSPRKTPRRNHSYADTKLYNERQVPDGLKPKDLCGIPWRVAFALQAQGWYLRSDIIYSKQNPMPESVTDRPTRSHEYIFLLTKSPTYFYDAEAIKEKSSDSTHARSAAASQFPARSERDVESRRRLGVHPKAQQHLLSGEHKVKQNGSFCAAVTQRVSQRNRRSVWTVTTDPYRGAHFATFPAALITPCVLAGTSEGGCCKGCGAPMERVLEDMGADLEHQRSCGGDQDGLYDGEAVKDYAGAGVQNASDVKARILAGMRIRKTIGWKATCTCRLPTVPCRVLDPFAGSGTTGEVALSYNREFTGIDLNPDYLPLQQRRTAQAALL